ncbi:MAG: GTPase ObgE [Clostridia bacterium]|nr:GTPase ObgE [Clostridia bacterium]
MFIDRIQIHVKAGNGGNGAVAFHREKYISHGGPDGGDGGKGGSIVMRIDEGSNTLLAFRYHRKFVAQNGSDGSGKKFHGASADDLYILVPPGTVIRDAESGLIIHDMSENGGADFVVCRGGRGGWGNRHFATPTRQLPMFAKSGTKGEEKDLLLELKMIADVGLIGYPSVGKSSILSCISAAKPKIADYHFTTLSPNLGVVSLPSDDGSSKGFVAADIPGLIEGASEGAGLGHEFLRHVDRCRLLLHVVDIAAVEGRDPVEDIKIINTELEKYSPELSERPQIVIANKCDAVDRNSEGCKAFEKYVADLGCELLYTSAATGEGLDEMVELVAEKLKELPPLRVFEAEVTEEEKLPGERERHTEYRKEGRTFYVEGEWLFNLCGQVNFADYESLNFFRKVLRKSGVIDTLKEMGVTEGDTVSIYDFEFDWVE